MPQVLFMISAIAAGIMCAGYSFAATDTVIKHRAVTERTEPDLPEKTKAIIYSEAASGALEINCQRDKGLSVEVVFTRSSVRADGDAGITMKYWADQGRVSEDKAWPSGRRGAILPNGRQILDDAVKASVLHIEIETADRPSAVMVFRPNNATSTLQKMQSDCQSDAPPPDQNGLVR